MQRERGGAGNGGMVLKVRRNEIIRRRRRRRRTKRRGRFLLRLSLSHLCSPPPSEAQKLPYYASYGPARLAIHTLCTSHYLDLVITFIICINVITMSLEHYSQPQVGGGWRLAGWVGG